MEKEKLKRTNLEIDNSEKGYLKHDTSEKNSSGKEQSKEKKNNSNNLKMSVLKRNI